MLSTPRSRESSTSNTNEANKPSVYRALKQRSFGRTCRGTAILMITIPYKPDHFFFPPNSICKTNSTIIQKSQQSRISVCVSRQ
jgi:hypothetical protein